MTAERGQMLEQHNGESVATTRRYEEARAGLEQQITTLMSELEGHANRYATSEQERQGLLSDLEIARGEIDKLSSLNAELSSSGGLNRKRLDEIMNELEETRAEARRVSSERDTLRETYTGLENEHSALTRKYGSLESDVTTLTTKSAELQDELNKYKESTGQFDISNKEAQRQIQELQQRLGTQAGEYSKALTERDNQLSTIRSRYATETEELQAKVEEAMTRAEAAHKNYLGEKARYDALDAQYEMASGTIQQYSSTINDQQSRLARMGEMIVQQENEFSRKQEEERRRWAEEREAFLAAKEVEWQSRSESDYKALMARQEASIRDEYRALMSRQSEERAASEKIIKDTLMREFQTRPQQVKRIRLTDGNSKMRLIEWKSPLEETPDEMPIDIEEDDVPPTKLPTYHGATVLEGDEEGSARSSYIRTKDPQKILKHLSAMRQRQDTGDRSTGEIDKIKKGKMLFEKRLALLPADSASWADVTIPEKATSSKAISWEGVSIPDKALSKKAMKSAADPDGLPAYDTALDFRTDDDGMDIDVDDGIKSAREVNEAIDIAKSSALMFQHMGESGPITRTYASTTIL